jgi:CDP-diacylglycerol--serine O-phosphatidyltransferase
MNLLANFLSILSLACGFVSIIFSLESHFTFACWAIILSVIFDGLDGQVARRNPVPSEFGKELDSLVDVISFGIAPSVLGYIFVYRDFYFWAAVALFIYALCSVMRLAKYNITPKEKDANYFIGLPTTAAGGMLASFALIYRKKEDMFMPGFLPSILSPKFIPVIFLIIVLILAYLMVSRIRYLNLDGLKHIFGRKIKLVIFIVGVLISAGIYFDKAGVIFCGLFLIYLIFSPFVVKRLNSRK